MEITPELLAQAHQIIARANSTTPGTSTTQSSRPPVYKAVGLTLAIASGVFIGISFVLKKTGLLKANAKYNEEAGEGYGYLKNVYWWTGMTLMIIGEVCNFVAYAFVDAILVTPLGALSVVITTILSAIFLKERLSFVGKVGCFNCIIGSVVIVMNAPQQSSVATIQDMKHFVIAPGFLSYAGVIIVGCTFIALWVGPRYGKKSMLVYLSICSLIGGLSVVATQGLGAAVVAQAGGKPQFNQWFLYVLLVFVITTLVTEIIFLNVSTDPKDRNEDTDKVCRKLSISSMRLSSHPHITFSSRVPRSSPPLFSFKDSRVHLLLSPLS
jgi:drug/metabolite transporter (DMT)-like permease